MSRKLYKFNTEAKHVNKFNEIKNNEQKKDNSTRAKNA